MNIVLNISEDDYKQFKTLDNEGFGTMYNGLVGMIANASTLNECVTNQPCAAWINNTHKSGCGITFLDYECSWCHEHFDHCSNYCPECGRKMFRKYAAKE